MVEDRHLIRRCGRAQVENRIALVALRQALAPKGNSHMIFQCGHLNRARESSALKEKATGNSRLWLWSLLVFITVASLWLTSPVSGQQYDPEIYAGLKWRLIGPHRGGRVTTVAGIPKWPAVYYFGTPGGGVWKT